MKTKPTQNAVRTLNAAGVQPDIIIARSERPVDEKRKEKISIFCNVQKEDVISAPDIKTIYEVPLKFEKEGLSQKILKKFNLRPKKTDLREWKKLVKIVKGPKKKVKIGIAGKYFRSGKFTLMDSYISVIEAIKHASYYFGAEPDITWLDTGDYEKNPRLLSSIKNFNGIIVPGGFGSRGTEGKIQVIRTCRTQKIPFFGLCFGLQLAVVEFARYVCGLQGANSTEINSKTKYPVIDLMLEQKKLISQKKYGGTMRLGAYSCLITPKTISLRAYGQQLISERHRHRYEVNNAYRENLKKKGLMIAGINPEMDLVEIIELKNHPFFVATQFHPEFKSRPLKPHPLFREFIRGSLKQSRKR
jgi:CTP synthase